jgi:hypothetical protein
VAVGQSKSKENIMKGPSWLLRMKERFINDMLRKVEDQINDESRLPNLLFYIALLLLVNSPPTSI